MRQTYPSKNTILKVMVDIGDVQFKIGFECENWVWQEVKLHLQEKYAHRYVSES